MTRKNIPVPVDCLDKERSLLFTFDSANVIKGAFKSNPLMWAGIDWLTKLVDPENLPIVLNALMGHEKPTPTVEAIRAMITSGDQLDALSKAVMRSVAHFQGKTDEEFDEELQKSVDEALKLQEAPTADPPLSPSVN